MQLACTEKLITWSVFEVVQPKRLHTHLDGYDEITACFQERGSVETQDASLIWLRNICEEDVHHANQHSVLVRMPGILKTQHQQNILTVSMNRIQYLR